MKKGYIQHTGLDELHNRIHRMAFLNPETTYITQTKPTLDTLDLGESRIYKDGSQYFIYFKLSKTELGRMEINIV